MIYEDKLGTLKECLEESNNNLLTDLIYYLAKLYLGESYDESEYYDILSGNIVNSDGVHLIDISETDNMIFNRVRFNHANIQEAYLND